MKKQTMWLVNEDLFINQVDILFDGMKPAYAIYLNDAKDPNAYKVKDEDQLFASKSEAEKYAEERRKKIIVQMGEVKKFIERMGDIDMGDHTYKEEDYLGYKATDDYYERRYREQYNINIMFKNYIMHGTVNLDAYTFRYDEVKRVKWCKKQDTYFATLILKDGTEVQTNSSIEYGFIEFLFGVNNSDKIFSK